MINHIVANFIKEARKLSKKEKKRILEIANRYYDNNDPDDPKHRWDHMLDVMETAKKIRKRDLDADEFGMIAFHDSGYKHPKGYAFSKKIHGPLGAKIFRKEGPGLGYTPEEVKHIAKVIGYHNHSPKSKYSPLLKDDLQMLMFSADEGTPMDLKDDAAMYFRKGRSGVYKGVDPESKDFIKQLVAKVRTFGNYSKKPQLKYYNELYPGYLQSKYDYWHSDDLEKDFEDMIEEELKEKKASKLYTYVEPDADLSLGILSARQAPEDILLRRYPGRAKSKKELLELMQERLDDEDRPDLVYALSEPIPDRATEKLRRFRDARKLVSYDTDNIKDLIKILKRRYRKPPIEVKDIERKKYIQWGRKPKDGGAFFYAPVYKLLTEGGKIPPEILKEE